jgi:hypothetical protein
MLYHSSVMGWWWRHGVVGQIGQIVAVSKVNQITAIAHVVILHDIGLLKSFCVRYNDWTGIGCRCASSSWAWWTPLTVFSKLLSKIEMLS